MNEAGAIKIITLPKKPWMAKTLDEQDDSLIQRMNHRVEFYANLDTTHITRAIICKKALLKIKPCIKYVQKKQQDSKMACEKAMYARKEKKLSQVQADLQQRLTILNLKNDIAHGKMYVI